MLYRGSRGESSQQWLTKPVRCKRLGHDAAPARQAPGAINSTLAHGKVEAPSCAPLIEQRFTHTCSYLNNNCIVAIFRKTQGQIKQHLRHLNCNPNYKTSSRTEVCGQIDPQQKAVHICTLERSDPGLTARQLVRCWRFLVILFLPRFNSFVQTKLMVHHLLAFDQSLLTLLFQTDRKEFVLKSLDAFTVCKGSLWLLKEHLVSCNCLGRLLPQRLVKCRRICL